MSNVGKSCFFFNRVPDETLPKKYPLTEQKIKKKYNYFVHHDSITFFFFLPIFFILNR